MWKCTDLDSAAGWRRERDSNPRYSLRPYDALAKRCLQPLGHLSGASLMHLIGWAGQFGSVCFRSNIPNEFRGSARRSTRFAVAPGNIAREPPTRRQRAWLRDGQGARGNHLLWPQISEFVGRFPSARTRGQDRPLAAGQGPVCREGFVVWMSRSPDDCRLVARLRRRCFIRPAQDRRALRARPRSPLSLRVDSKI